MVAVLETTISSALERKIMKGCRTKIFRPISTVVPEVTGTVLSTSPTVLDRGGTNTGIAGTSPAADGLLQSTPKFKDKRGTPSVHAPLAAIDWAIRKFFMFIGTFCTPPTAKLFRRAVLLRR
jgi:hypothetical protein